MKKQNSIRRSLFLRRNRKGQSGQGTMEWVVITVLIVCAAALVGFLFRDTIFNLGKKGAKTATSVNGGEVTAASAEADSTQGQIMTGFQTDINAAQGNGADNPTP